MSLMQLTEYLLWKSLRHKTQKSAGKYVNIKQEWHKQEIFNNDNMICRVCTSPAEIPITAKMENTLIISAIRTVTNISITEADCYPKYVCKICLGELKIAFNFKKKCESSDMAFRKAISSEAVLVNNSQPMVMHDFSLILHEMQQKRISKQVAIKKENLNYDSYDFHIEDIPSLSTSHILESHLKSDINGSQTETKNNTTKSNSCLINKLENTSDCNNYDDLVDSNTKANIVNNITKRKKHQRIPKCQRCDLKFDTEEQFIRHRKENGCVYHACPLCGKLVLKLANHERIVHSRTNKYTCHQCGKIYYSSGALVNHMHKHKETKEYFCEHCPYKGKRKSYLVGHMRVHTGEHRYLCSMCPLKFTNFSNMTKHQLIHFNKKFECSKCKRLFRQEKHLKDHFDAAHLNIRYRCSICGKDLSTRKKLLNHELRVHKREKHKLFEEIQRVVIGNDND